MALNDPRLNPDASQETGWVQRAPWDGSMAPDMSGLLTVAEMVAAQARRQPGMERSMAFVHEAEMPRTATGKILHRTLREHWLATRRSVAPEPDGA